jgi:hypothetical protein
MTSFTNRGITQVGHEMYWQAWYTVACHALHRMFRASGQGWACQGSCSSRTDAPQKVGLRFWCLEVLACGSCTASATSFS